MNLSKYLSVTYTKWLFWIVVSFVWGTIFFQSYSEDLFDWQAAVHGTGELAWKLLLFTIFISLLQKLFPRVGVFAKLLPLRKYTGIFSFLIAMSHVFASLIQYGVIHSFAQTLGFVIDDISMAFGMIAFLVMLPVFLTSTNYMQKKKGYRFWKNVQRLTHLGFIFTAVHIIFIKFMQTGDLDLVPLIPLSVYMIGYGYLFIRKKYF